MSGTGTVRRTATLFALALLGASTMAVAQVPAKPTPAKDTTKQTTSKPRIKISKETKTSAGEVVLQAKPKVDSTTPCEVALPTINPLHDDSVRSEQRTLDSATALFDRTRLTREFNAREAATREAARQNPSLVQRVSRFYAQHPQLVQTLGQAAIAIAMNGMARRRRM